MSVHYNGNNGFRNGYSFGPDARRVSPILGSDGKPYEYDQTALEGALGRLSGPGRVGFREQLRCELGKAFGQEQSAPAPVSAT
jgi:hypothetical protein